MKSIEKFISDIVSEASLDHRIPSGVVDLKNIDHVQVIAERIYDMCEDETLVSEFLREFINEGKYPERQAYNKDGWLVTFPSKEYRDAAIKKGTHSSSDPTHGKGGMNLYYKKKGKQKRQTQQTATVVQTTQPQQTPKPQITQPTKVAPTSAQPLPTKQQDIGAKTSFTKQQRADRLAKLTGEPTKANTDRSVTQVPQSTQASQPTEKPATVPKPSEVPAVEVPVVETPPEQYASISKKFATKKGWMSEPYGEYRDREGNTVAIVGLSGEVVPVKSVDRDEYKLFAEKLML